MKLTWEQQFRVRNWQIAGKDNSVTADWNTHQRAGEQDEADITSVESERMGILVMNRRFADG